MEIDERILKMMHDDIDRVLTQYDNGEASYIDVYEIASVTQTRLAELLD